MPFAQHRRNLMDNGQLARQTCLKNTAHTYNTQHWQWKTDWTIDIMDLRSQMCTAVGIQSNSAAAGLTTSVAVEVESGCANPAWLASCPACLALALIPYLPPCSPSSINWYRHKLGAKQALHVTHWPPCLRTCSFGCFLAEGYGNGDRCCPMGPPWSLGHCGSGRTLAWAYSKATYLSL